ncbi:MAG TPA: hypothetical protein VGR73_04075 [Bryobacteraceae bacterium]|nr:hypothetical protein [Bryobacteraceae bacterium]
MAGLALVGCALATDRRWLDRHFLPPFFVSRQVYVLVASLVRIALAVLGLALASFARPRIGRFLAQVTPGRLLPDLARIFLAVALALGASELVLRFTFRRSSEEQPASQVPWRRRDPRLGWVFVPARTGRDIAGGRMIEYAFDSAGYRVRRPGDSVDPERPTILFTGESIMAGQGLTWEETVPARVEALTGVQSANLAVHGFATDQSYLRLLDELPRFHRPVAVVALFTPALFDRNLDEDRPHLGAELVWVPPKPRWRLAIIANWLVPYRSEEAIERGIVLTRAVLRAMVNLARTRGAVPLIVVPQFLPEDPTERLLRRRILDETGLPYVWVGLDPSWRLPHDLHPDPRAAQAMAVAVATHLGMR